MKLSLFLFSLSSIFGLMAATPNVVLMMCDDLGWGDVGFNGATHIRTPHLDEMAEEGFNLTRFYAQAPVCSPTRASVVTGRHHDRTGIYYANNGHLREGEFTIYEALSAMGYATGHFGKWHMGTLTRETKDANRGGPGGVKEYSVPWEHGVATTFATESKTPTYDPMWKPSGGSKKDFTAADGKGWHPIPEDTPKEFYGTHYWTGEETMVQPESDKLLGDDSKVIMDHTLPFIEDAVAEEKPFLAVVWFHAPHLPVVASPEDVALYADETDSGFDQNYRGCVTAIDREVGRLRAALRELGVEENTIVAFCSDNGPEGGQSSPGKQGELRGRKRDLYEGGVRVPSLVEWPGTIAPGASDAATCTVDYFPTLMKIVGFKMPDDRDLDGINILPILKGKVEARSQPLGFHIKGKAAWHDGDWKIIRQKNGAKWQLFNLSEDSAEMSDLAAKFPERVETMAAGWKAWKVSVDASDAGGDY